MTLSELRMQKMRIINAMQQSAGELQYLTRIARWEEAGSIQIADELTRLLQFNTDLRAVERDIEEEEDRDK